ncbi:hypothetical protein DDB_G0279731 [Dictyostelium discoideum AX4]|uniref:t-SNARE coiled-coil homology domain-containing protein n=1 Tax=Dictyostelium discoideum TaxID=44689 RepID=Q54WF8_DICDI|nr:hypothetical protein DDB_G0279731 [Dictyostelium discoideum AX4]EAL67640.1 hypothetical protein DDB_G0279731 [Dictyostelium discoideum AX4]|eukprot:XP_641595.1 hypothetical protein DDB_G0279731 [Dictyostelium discoideum AX4]
MSSFEQIATYLNSLNETTQKIQSKKSTINSSRDTVEFRGTIKSDIENGKTLINNIKQQLSGFSRADRVKVNKLTGQFNELTKQFEKESTEIINLQLRNAIGSGGRSASLSINNRDASSRSGSLAGRIHPVHNNNNFNNNNKGYNNNDDDEIKLQTLEITLSNAEPVEELILQEYNTEVQTLVKDLTMLKEISNDLHLLTTEQRAPLEQASKNVDMVEMNVSQGNQELVKANQYACSARKKVVIIVILVLIVIGLVVGLCVGLVKK